MKMVLAITFALLNFVSVAHADQTSTSEVANRFYTAFQQGNAVTMGQQYADVDTYVFTDEIFQKLNVGEARKMWVMLLNTPNKPVVKYELVVAGEDHAIVHWEADYVFSKTGRAVHNDVTSILFINNGKIVRQVDKFDLCSWTRQAFGVVKGTAICTFPDHTIRKQARENLAAF